MASSRGTGGKSVQVLQSLPMPPNCLLRDELGLPDSRELSAIAGVALPAGLRISHAALRRMVLQAKRASVMYGADYALTLMGMVSNMEAQV
jgi:hypothetical protein